MWGKMPGGQNIYLDCIEEGDYMVKRGQCEVKSHACTGEQWWEGIVATQSLVRRHDREKSWGPQCRYIWHGKGCKKSRQYVNYAVAWRAQSAVSHNGVPYFHLHHPGFQSFLGHPHCLPGFRGYCGHPLDASLAVVGRAARLPCVKTVQWWIWLHSQSKRYPHSEHQQPWICNYLLLRMLGH